MRTPAPAGAGVRIAIVDSGVAIDHPHIGGIVTGIQLDGDRVGADVADRIGHGTAVAAAIHDLAPGAELCPIRVFDRALATTATSLAAAINWAAEHGAYLVNLSLGTANVAHEQVLRDAVTRASSSGCVVVSARSVDGTSFYPGSIEGVLGIEMDPTLARSELRVTQTHVGLAVWAAPWPRPVEGVPKSRNLFGVSFAVANATAIVATLLSGHARPSYETVRRLLLEAATSPD